MSEQVYVLYAPNTLEDCNEVISICDLNGVSYPKYLIDNKPYNPKDAYFISYGKHYLICFTGTLSCSYMSNNEVNYYGKIVLNKEAFIFYMLNKTWDTFDTLSKKNVLEWLEKNMPPNYCNSCEFKIYKYVDNTATTGY